MVRKINKTFSESYMVDTCTDTISYAGPYPVFYALNIVGHQWETALLLLINDMGNVCFTDLLERFKGLSKYVLIKMLRDLESECMIRKEITGEIGNDDYRVEYCLTNTGKKLIPIINSLNDWGIEQKKQKALISV